MYNFMGSSSASSSTAGSTRTYLYTLCHNFLTIHPNDLEPKTDRRAKVIVLGLVLCLKNVKHMRKTWTMIQTTPHWYLRDQFMTSTCDHICVGIFSSVVPLIGLWLTETSYCEKDNFRDRDLRPIHVTQCRMPSKFSETEILHNILIYI